MSDLIASAARRPRLRVLANGMSVIGVRDAEVSSNNHYAADRFTVSIALGADPVWTAAYWSEQASVLLDVQMGFVPDGAPEGAVTWVSLVQGAVDTIRIGAPEQLVHLQGRDLTAAFIEARTQETFANRTASEIATILAARHNLSAQVTPTTTLVGRHYELEHDRTTLDQFSRSTTEWDLLVSLAQNEGFDIFVQGTTLYFQQARTTPLVPNATLRPAATANGPANVMELGMDWALTLAGDVEVTVKSWNSRQGNANAQTVSATGAPGSGTPQSYVLVRPNLMPDEALNLAQKWLAALTQHERVINAVMPGDLILTARSIVAVEGTGTSFDQIYYVDTIERHLSFQGGFVQHLRAKNSSAARQASPPASVATTVNG